MKKPVILFCSVFISICILAQKNPVKNDPNDNFCNALSKVIAQAPGQFENLKTGGYLAFLNPQAGSWVGNGWVASVNFPGAFLSNIEQLENGPNTYNAYLGNYQSEADARKEAGIIKNKLSACLPGFTIEDRAYMQNNLEGFPINFYFIEKKRGTSPQQIVNLYLSKDSSIHNIFLRIIGADVNGTVLEAIIKKPENNAVEASQRLEDLFDQLFEDLETFKEIDQTKLAKQLVELLKHAETKFETIKGEKNVKESVTNELYTSVVYKTNYQLEGAVKNRIEDVDRKRYYEATYLENADEDAASSLFDNLFSKIKLGLGDTFNYENEQPTRSDGTKKFKISLKKENTHFIRFILNVKEELVTEKDELGLLSVKTKKKWSVKLLVF